MQKNNATIYEFVRVIERWNTRIFEWEKTVEKRREQLKSMAFRQDSLERNIIFYDLQGKRLEFEYTRKLFMDFKAGQLRMEQQLATMKEIVRIMEVKYNKLTENNIYGS
jgi:hypothetical protein